MKEHTRARVLSVLRHGPSTPGHPGIRIRPVIGLHFGTVVGGGGRDVAALAHLNRVHEMLVEMIDVFHDAVFERGAAGDVIPEGKVLHVFAEPEAAGVGADGDVELLCHQHDAEALVHAAQRGPASSGGVTSRISSATWVSRRLRAESLRCSSTARRVAALCSHPPRDWLTDCGRVIRR
jgi:hypothetical protein